MISRWRRSPVRRRPPRCARPCPTRRTRRFSASSSLAASTGRRNSAMVLPMAARSSIPSCMLCIHRMRRSVSSSNAAIFECSSATRKRDSLWQAARAGVRSRYLGGATRHLLGERKILRPWRRPDSGVNTNVATAIDAPVRRTERSSPSALRARVRDRRTSDRARTSRHPRAADGGSSYRREHPA